MFTEQPDIVWGLIASLFIGNVILLILNIPLVGLFAKMLNTPNYILIPAIATVSFVGVYAIHSNTFDLVLMVALGILGYVLGEMMESNLRRALSISHGNVDILFQGPIVQVLWALVALMIVLPIYRILRSKRKPKMVA